MSDDLDPSSLLGDPTAQEQAAAYAAALRRQQYDSGLLHVFGNKGLSDLGSSMSGQAQNALGDLRARDQSQGALLMRMLGAHRTRQVKRADGSIVSVDQLTGEPVEDVGEAGSIIRKSGDGSLNSINLGDPTKVTQLTKPAPHVGRGAAGAPGGVDKQADKWAHDYDARMSASGARAGAMGQDYVRLSNAQNLKTILDGGGGIVPPQMVAEATAALGRLVTGGVVTEGTMEKMIPHTAGMDLAQKLQYITGSPHDAGVKAFLEYMGHTADREAANASGRIKAERLARHGAFAQYYKLHPADLYRQAGGYGLTKEDVDGYFNGTPPAGSSAGDGHGSAQTPNAAALTIYNAQTGQPFVAPSADVKAKALASKKYRETP